MTYFTGGKDLLTLLFIFISLLFYPKRRGKAEIVLKSSQSTLISLKYVIVGSAKLCNFKLYANTKVTLWS